MNIDHIVPSTLKVIASENVDIENDLNKPESSKSIEQLLDDQEKQQPEKETNGQ